jgi:cation diffusion facilitator family transporter
MQAAPNQRLTLWIALGLNATMFLVGLAIGLVGQSSGLIADSLDMLADATAYGIALWAIHKAPQFQARAAFTSGIFLALLGFGALGDALRRGLVGSAPEGTYMIATALLSLGVNVTVMRLLGRVREEGVHLKAAWIFTRADVVANAGVILSGLIILVTGWRMTDVVVGALIAAYIVKESFEILADARRELTIQKVP